MLLAVEGGGFFSSSASGYSKGLSLLLLGRKDDDKSMRVLPWSQYRLVGLEPENNLQLASTKNRLSRGCASFICFGRVTAGVDTPSPLKVGPVQHQETLPDSLDLYNSNNHEDAADVENDIISTKIGLKSSLKKPAKSKQVSSEQKNELKRTSDGVSCAGEFHEERRKVQWTDACGNELIEIREFEPSEKDDSDDELENGNEQSCSCSIM